MFKVFIVEDVINLTVSEYFNDNDNLFRKLSNKYINKVIQGIGLVLAIDENFLRCECKILQTEGSAHYKITFRILVFHPSVNDTFNASFLLDSLMTFKLYQNSCLQILNRWVVTNGSSKHVLKENDLVVFKTLDVIYNKNKEDTKLYSNSSNLPVLVIIGTISEEIDTH
ncbi:uncharacterized protein TA12655 [Theileria annulata]|uniref:Uncharacterized protein n=1 Tax=Theileria annulata TaxID=5874 RepID=Q4UE47_THEAN|nr:uncharacterized protein TA12655 [Theileria annulata]CAI74642.1 hypothetical protein TA12655 [Theileria annulata]|eukprot:XP_952374.1 hypothetical protein TA12655 [Theileria annulata]